MINSHAKNKVNRLLAIINALYEKEASVSENNGEVLFVINSNSVNIFIEFTEKELIEESMLSLTVKLVEGCNHVFSYS